MNQKTKTLLKVVAILLVALMILMHLNIVAIPVIAAYKFWVVVGAFILLLLSS